MYSLTHSLDHIIRDFLRYNKREYGLTICYRLLYGGYSRKKGR